MNFKTLIYNALQFKVAYFILFVSLNSYWLLVPQAIENQYFENGGTTSRFSSGIS